MTSIAVVWYLGISARFDNRAKSRTGSFQTSRVDGFSAVYRHRGLRSFISDAAHSHAAHVIS